MNYVPDRKSLSPYAGRDRQTSKAVPKKSRMWRVFSAIFHALYDSRRRQAELEIERFVARQGRRMTDDLERRMNRRLFTSDWRKHE